MKAPKQLRIDYGPAIEPHVAAIEATIARSPEVLSHYPARWLALELLEDGADLRDRLREMPGGSDVVAVADSAMEALRSSMGDTALVAVASRRYAWIHEVVEAAVDDTQARSATISDRLDRVLTHRVAGLPIFLVAMWIVFKLTADVSAVYLDWIDGVINGPIARWMAALVAGVGLGGTWVESLVVDGIVVGVGGILVFIPVLVTLYLCLAFLEDSGYMARAALIMDRTMRRLGLPGRSFLPMLVGFGCTVPAIYATRTLENRKDRILTGLLVPFMSCGARLPVYVLIAAVFFSGSRGVVVFSMYLLGIAVALVLGLVLKRTVFGSAPRTPLVMELPSYHWPNLRTVWQYTWVRTSAFVRDAGTIILGTSVVVWLLMAVPVTAGEFADTPIEHSAFGTVSTAVAPVFEPAGFGSAETTGALVTGFVAKEVVISTMAQTYGVDPSEPEETHRFGDDLATIGTGFWEATVDTIKTIPSIVGIDLLDDEDALESQLVASIRSGFEASSGGHGALAGIAFLVFVLLYTPCMAAVAAERRELGSRWMWASIVGQTSLAWIMAVAVFQAGSLLGVG